MRILVIGGTLFIGKRLVSRLLTKGHEITLLHRKAEHPFGGDVHSVVADRNNAESVRSALTGELFDAVFDLVYDWERGTTGQQVEAGARAIPGELSCYIFISSAAAYGEGLHHREEDALAPDSYPEIYSRNKAMSERALFRMHLESNFPAVTIRPPFVYGPENPFYREAFFWDRILRDRPIIIPGDGKRLMQFVHVDDLVGACCAALEEPAAVGKAFNVASETPVTHLELVHALAAAAGKKAKPVFVPREVIARHGGDVFHEPLYFGEYYDLPSITQRVDRFKQVLHMEPTPFAKGLQQTYEWYASQKKHREPNFSFEDKLILEAQSATDLWE